MLSLHSYFLEKLLTSLKSFALVAYSVDVVLPDISSNYESWLIKSEQNLVTFHPAKIEWYEDTRDIYIGWSQKSVNEYDLSLAVDG